uniref:PORR domain-containing protein n=1 Tax=Ananas comosus var. bracteatus TaxID=296719 RepID=A0A6V7PDN2_ANACO|nr:unnamed protein product [Ananas comosus var. bracteatus]
MVAKLLSHRNCRRISCPLLPRMKRRDSEIAVPAADRATPRISTVAVARRSSRGFTRSVVHRPKSTLASARLKDANAAFMFRAERASNDARGSSSSSSSSSLGTHSYGETAYWDDRYRKDGGPSTGTKSMRPSPLSSTSTSAAPTASSSSVAATQVPFLFFSFFFFFFVFGFGAFGYLKMDVRDMAGFESNSFDGVIDKGTLDSIMCGHNAHENATKMLEEVASSQDKGVYILITYGDPSYRLCVLKNLDTWTINMHTFLYDVSLYEVHAMKWWCELRPEKHPAVALQRRLDRSPEQKSWELTKPLRLNEDGTSVAALLGSNPDVHYIYVCIKDESLRQKRNNNRVDREAKMIFFFSFFKLVVVKTVRPDFGYILFSFMSRSRNGRERDRDRERHALVLVALLVLTAASSASAAAAGRAARNVVVSPTQGVSSLKVPWRRDPALDSAIERDKRPAAASRSATWRSAAPASASPSACRPSSAATPTSSSSTRTASGPPPLPGRPLPPPVPSLLSFLALRDRLLSLHEPLLLAKLVKLLMMSRHRALPADKLLCVKRDFGFPDDLLTSLVPAHPDLLRLSGHPGHGPCFVELVAWDHSYARSAVEARADAESELTGVRMRPNFAVRLPRGFYLKKEMREWARDWLELPYISPYADASALHPASREMEKRAVGLLHELLSLTLHKRAAVPILGKFCDEFRLSNAFASAFTRHPGIFYVSLKGGIKTAMLREAYDELGELVDRDPLLAIKDKFVEMMEEGHRITWRR